MVLAIILSIPALVILSMVGISWYLYHESLQWTGIRWEIEIDGQRQEMLASDEFSQDLIRHEQEANLRTLLRTGEMMALYMLVSLAVVLVYAHGDTMYPLLAVGLYLLIGVGICVLTCLAVGEWERKNS